MNQILESITNYGEEWKPTIKRGKIIPGYLVSNYGRVFSLKSNKLLKIQNNIHLERGNASTVSLRIPKDWSEDYQYANNTILCQVHQLVAEAFMPIDENPPKELEEIWNQIITPDMVGMNRVSECLKEWVKSTVIIDHLNDDPFDNRSSNFRYTNQLENNTHRKKKKLNEQS